MPDQSASNPEGAISDSTTTPRAGDPEGRRLARRRAAILAEAEQVGRVLEILLDRAGMPTTTVTELIRSLGAQQRRQLQVANGRIESRTRFTSRGGQPLQRHLPVNTLYVDESGTSHVPRGDTPEYFALGGIAIGDGESDRYRIAADTIKRDFFGRTDFQFHDPYMRNRTQTRHVDYSFSRDAMKQQAFDDAIGELLEHTEFVAVGVCIRKNAFDREFVQSGLDPYLPFDVYSIAMTLLLERYVDAIAYTQPESMGRVRAESQGPREDAYHQIEYARLLLEGSQWVSEKAFQQHLQTGMIFSPKRNSDPAELADIFARDLYEWVRGGCTVKPKWWHIFNRKIYVRGDGRMGKFGVKVFPDADIRGAIDQHRINCGAHLTP